LDPFSGDGTTLMVALQLGHRAIGIELNADYIETSKQRIAEAPARFKMPHESGTQPHHHRLKNAVADGIAERDRRIRLVEELAKHAPIPGAAHPTGERQKFHRVNLVSGSKVSQSESATVPHSGDAFAVSDAATKPSICSFVICCLG
jgi:hypothetical protein